MANLAAAELIRDRARVLLTKVHHAPHTRTPSPKSYPPAMISGALAASMHASHDGDDALVGPTAAASSKNGPYGRFLELGGEHSAHNSSGEMHWYEDGQWWHRAAIRKGPRPYLMPATEDKIHDGSVYQAYYDRWLIAQQSVT